jgi:two-component system response regulator GlrR
MSHKPAHLLLVDDDPGLLKLLGLRLTSEGYSVVTAESGAEGLRVLNREKVDLVISDLRMDEMDGMQLFAEIQKVQPGMPVIILTAHGSIPDAVAATQQGVFSFLTKPVDKDALYQAIDDALEQSASGLDFTGCVYSYRGRTSFNCATDPLCDGRNHPSAACFPNE